MKKWFSYIWPYTRQVESEYSGTLEITWMNGRKMLDSKQANYSFGSLQRVLEAGLAQVQVVPEASVLVLGMGGGSVIHSLRNQYNHTGPVTAVELDAKIIALARTEFGLSEFSNVEIVQGDALHVVANTVQKYDLVIVDVFIDNTVPAPFYSLDFCLRISGLLPEEGQIIWNLGLNQVRQGKEADVISCFQEAPGFTHILLENVEGTNAVLCVKKIL